jgi:Rps23 Pro-64 3,4-dihydroxylase Tpa1-like proline 4-hydroxylase
VEDNMPPVIRDVLRELNSQRMIAWLETLTGIPGLLPDPLLFGGGMFAIERGGFLKVHVDFNMHPHNGLDRRINLLLYLNEDWQEEYGGQLELWRKDAPKPDVSILPLANRCAIFSTNEISYHGHPTPLNCPEGRSRNCLSLYYYTRGRPKEEQAPAHNTIYIDTPS